MSERLRPQMSRLAVVGLERSANVVVHVGFMFVREAWRDEAMVPVSRA